jgi:hypothetical protein
VIGVSRSVGLGAAVTQRLHDIGTTVFAIGHPVHIDEMPSGEQPLGELPFPVQHHGLDDATVPTRTSMRCLLTNSTDARQNCPYGQVLNSEVAFNRFG